MLTHHADPSRKSIYLGGLIQNGFNKNDGVLKVGHYHTTTTMEQLLEAEQRAAEWMKKTRKIPPASIEDSLDRPPKLETDASTA
jgi:hypothetical protein